MIGVSGWRCASLGIELSVRRPRRGLVISPVALLRLDGWRVVEVNLTFNSLLEAGIIEGV
jgi:hypothetical protein